MRKKCELPFINQGTSETEAMRVFYILGGFDEGFFRPVDALKIAQAWHDCKFQKKRTRERGGEKGEKKKGGGDNLK